MKQSQKTILGILLFVIFLSAAVLAYQALSDRFQPGSGVQAGTDQTSAASGENPAPDFTVFDADGQAVKLSDFAGKPIVLNFWASWCPPCQSEMPHFDEVYQEVQADVVFLMVDLADGQRETQAKGLQYVQEQGFSFPVYFDTRLEAAEAYAITAIPATILIDKNGQIADQFRGAIDAETLRSAIEAIR